MPDWGQVAGQKVVREHETVWQRRYPQLSETLRFPYFGSALLSTLDIGGTSESKSQIRPETHEPERIGGAPMMEDMSALPQTKRGRGRPKVMSDVDVRRRIVQEAFEVMCAQGYAGMNMNDVAARCGISKKTLYRLFPSKIALFAAITDAHRETMVDIPADVDDLSFVEALAKVFRADTDEETNRTRQAFVRIVLLETKQFPELKQVLDERGRDRTFQLLCRWLESQKSRRLTPSVDVPMLAKMLMDIAFGAFMHPAPADWPNFHDRASYLRKCFAMLAEGIVRSRI